jgi:hypothetical protein
MRRTLLTASLGAVLLLLSLSTASAASTCVPVGFRLDNRWYQFSSTSGNSAFVVLNQVPWWGNHDVKILYAIDDSVAADAITMKVAYSSQKIFPNGTILNLRGTSYAYGTQHGTAVTSSADQKRLPPRTNGAYFALNTVAFHQTNSRVTFVFKGGPCQDGRLVWKYNPHQSAKPAPPSTSPSPSFDPPTTTTPGSTTGSGTPPSTDSTGAGEPVDNNPGGVPSLPPDTPETDAAANDTAVDPGDITPADDVNTTVTCELTVVNFASSGLQLTNPTTFDPSIQSYLCSFSSSASDAASTSVSIATQFASDVAITATVNGIQQISVAPGFWSSSLQLNPNQTNEVSITVQSPGVCETTYIFTCSPVSATPPLSNVTYTWAQTTMGECEPVPGQCPSTSALVVGTQSWNYKCVNSDGIDVNDSLCFDSGVTKPSSAQQCETACPTDNSTPIVGPQADNNQGAADLNAAGSVSASLAGLALAALFALVAAF